MLESVKTVNIMSESVNPNLKYMKNLGIVDKSADFNPMKKESSSMSNKTSAIDCLIEEIRNDISEVEFVKLLAQYKIE